MSKRKPSVFARVLCVSARSGIIVALYLAAFLGALLLAAVLPEPWSAVGITALVLVAGLALRGKWPGRELRLESVGLGFETPLAAEPVVGGVEVGSTREGISNLKDAVSEVKHSLTNPGPHLHRNRLRRRRAAAAQIGNALIELNAAETQK
jgi:hypothetical protein